MTIMYRLVGTPLSADPLRVVVQPDVPFVGDHVLVGDDHYKVDARQWEVDANRVHVRLDPVTT